MNYCPDCGTKLVDGEHPGEPEGDAVAEVATAGIEAVRDVAVAAVTADAVADVADAAAEVAVAEAEAVAEVAEEGSEVAVAEVVAEAAGGEEIPDEEGDEPEEVPGEDEPEPEPEEEPGEPGEELGHEGEGNEPEPIMVAPPQHEDRAAAARRPSKPVPAFRRRRHVARR